MIPPKAVELIKVWEGCRLKAYRCSANVLTIGYGDTHNVKENMVITQEEAEKRLIKHLTELDAQLSTLLNVPLKPNQRAAILSLVFNIGIGAFRTSTLRKKINARDEEAVKIEFLKWNKVDGKVNQGLVNRRADELSVFLSSPDLVDLLPDIATEDEINDILEDVEKKVFKK